MTHKAEATPVYPPYGYPYPPHMMPMHPAMHGQLPPPYWPPQAHPAMAVSPYGYAAPAPSAGQSQAMLEGLLGEQAGIFKDLLHTLGVDDKEFWKGAMIGAAAALVFSNETVRGNLQALLGQAGELLKTGGEKVKCSANSAVATAAETASNVSACVGDNVQMGTDVLKDTASAASAGFKASVAKHRAADAESPAQGENHE